MRVALAAVAMVILAGCFSGSEEPPEAPQDDLQATATTGVIRCVVVDAAIVPVADALVTLDTGDHMRTGEDGTCGFSGIEPGAHQLRVSHPGFIAQETVAQVKAGDDAAETMRIRMDTDPDTVPSTETFIHKGHIACSTSYAAVCGIAGVRDASGDAYTAIVPLDETPDWLTVELFWDSTQAVSDELMLHIGATPAGPDNTCCRTHGTSPLSHATGGFIAREAGIGSEGDLFARVFAWEINDTKPPRCEPVIPPELCHGPGVAIQQDFEIIVHAFHNWFPGVEWRFSEDGAPETPTRP